MKQRLKLAFKILFCKKYIFFDGKKIYNNDVSVNSALAVAENLTNKVEKTLNQDKLLNEAKIIICQQ